MDNPLIFGYHLFCVTNLLGTQEAKQSRCWMRVLKPVPCRESGRQKVIGSQSYGCDELADATLPRKTN